MKRDRLVLGCSLAGAFSLILLLVSACNPQQIQTAQTVTTLAFQVGCAATSWANEEFTQIAATPGQTQINAATQANVEKWMGIANQVCAAIPKDLPTAFALIQQAQAAIQAAQTGGTVPPPPTSVPVAALPASS